MIFLCLFLKSIQWANRAKNFKNKAFRICIIAALVLVILAGCVLGISSIRRTVRNVLSNVFPDRFPRYVYYVNNEARDTVSEMDFLLNDVREVQINSERSYLVNHSRGFAVGFPVDAEYDFSAAQEFIKVKCSDFSCVVSKEYSTFGPSVEESKKYVAECINKYMLDEKYLKENNITLHKNDVETVGEYPVQIIALTRTPYEMSEVKDNTYVYCYIYKEDVLFYRLMFKAESYTDELMNEVYKTLESFSEGVVVKGQSRTFTDFKPVLNENWNEKTKDLYNDIKNSDECKWGVFVPRAVFLNNYQDVLTLEEKVDTKFSGVLEYMFLCDTVPKNGMKSAFDDGKVVELTLQTANVMHANLNGHNPMFEIIDGLYDEELAQMARDIKSLENPVLFRLNNEMNSDWVGYSGLACLNDPEIYVAVWRRIYNIFEKENVDNAIWVFNPNDETFPPNGYNTSLAYYPGNEYVHMFGITGYNTGTYYAGETWKTFTELYSDMYSQYSEWFDHPFMITEFACSSTGGDKEAWMKDMFRRIRNYDNIKIAIWWDGCDWDAEGNVARSYFLDETPGTLEIFKDGIVVPWYLDVYA